jgi:hypothetical protein
MIKERFVLFGFLIHYSMALLYISSSQTPNVIKVISLGVNVFYQRYHIRFLKSSILSKASPPYKYFTLYPFALKRFPLKICFIVFSFTMLSPAVGGKYGYG